MWMGIAIALAISLVVLLYWLLITTEGTYLGPGVVALLYDWTAKRYDGIKKLRFVDEALFVGVPLREALADVTLPRILDVATGTGRVPLALTGHWGFTGQIAGVDRARRMLAVAQEATHARASQITLVACDAERLCWADAAFDCVTCLEALEFVPHGERALAEMWRVLRPGGILLVSNRVGAEAGLFPGRVARRGRLEELLESLGFAEIRSQRWQMHYDLVWASKPRLQDQSDPLTRELESAE